MEIGNATGEACFKPTVKRLNLAAPDHHEEPLCKIVRDLDISQWTNEGEHLPLLYIELLRSM